MNTEALQRALYRNLLGFRMLQEVADLICEPIRGHDVIRVMKCEPPVLGRGYTCVSCGRRPQLTRQRHYSYPVVTSP